jgi:hypothetical protein
MSGSIVYDPNSKFFETFIEKPFSMKELMPTISKALVGSSDKAN